MGLTLEDAGDLLTWYNYVNPDKTVEIVNYLGEQAAAGSRVFMIFTRRKKRQPIRIRRTPVCSSFGESRE